MAQLLAEHSNAMAHIHEEYESSYQSILFVHAMMSSFHADLQSTTQTRRAQMSTMTTQAGLQLRTISLAMHSQLATYIHTKLTLYSHIAKTLHNKITQLKQSISQAEHCLRNYEQVREFIRAKCERADEELIRLSGVDYQRSRVIRVGYLKNLFNLYEVGEDRVGLGLGSQEGEVQRVRHKAEVYKKEHYSMIGHLEQSLQKQQQNISKLIGQFTVMTRITNNFDAIYEILAVHTAQNNQRMPKISKQSIRIQQQRPYSKNWSNLISLASNNPSQPNQRYSQPDPDQQQMLIR